MNTNETTILCVDDDPDLLDVTSEILRMDGYRVVRASSGLQCLDTVSGTQPDVILLDVNMPDIGGVEICRRIKSSPETSNIHVILISGTDISSDEQTSGLNAGAEGYVVRPVAPHELLARVRVFVRLKKADTALRDANRELKAKIAELEKAKKETENANMLKSNFLANISHEVTTPLNSVIGYSQILLDELYGKLNEKQKEYVTDILDGGRTLLRLITDIYDLSTALSGEMKLRPGRFLLSDVLKSAVSEISGEAAKNGLTLVTDISACADVEIEADVDKLKRIVSELLDNAVKFTPKGGSVGITARAVRMPDSAQAGDNIEISVSDTGIGIDESDISGLFTEFKQLESPYTKRYEGVGVGLMLVRKMVELHSGRVTVESLPGQGSVFRILLPAEQQMRRTSAENGGAV